MQTNDEERNINPYSGYTICTIGINNYNAEANI